MISVSDTWKAGMNANTHYTTTANVSLSNGSTLTLTADNICVKTNMFTDGAGVVTFPVGEAMSRTMQIEVDNADDSYSDIDFLNAVIWLYLNYGNESITVGKFTVTQPATYGETVIIQGQDDMYKADKAFATSLTYPTTAGALWAEICVSCGIHNGAGTIPQSSFEIATAPSTSLTYRAVLGYIAMLSGGNARVDRSGYLKIVNYDMDSMSDLIENDVIVTDDLEGNITARGAVSVQTSGGDVSILSGGTFTDDGSGNIVWSTSGSWDVHNLNMWHSLKVDKNDTTITGVSTTIIDSEGNSTEVLAGTSDYVISLSNPLWAGRERAAITTVKNAISGVPFRAFYGEYIAYPLAEFGDLARLIDRKGNVYYSFITDVTFTWASNTALKTSAEPPITSNATYTTPATEAVQTAATMVKAEKAAREQAIEALADALASSSGLYSTRESASGGGTIYYLHDQATLSDSTIVIKLTAEALGISTDGGQTYSQGWNFATGTTITNLLVANGIDASQIDVTNLDASNITTGTLSVGQLPGNVVTSSSSRTQYYLSTSNTTVTGGSWSSSVSWVSGTYIWTRTATTNTYADGTTSTTYSTAIYDENLTSAMSASTSSVGSANAREQTIYRSAASGTISMSAYTTWCTTTSNSQGVWTTRRPTYSSSYPVLFVATQRQTVTQYDSGNGTACSCTTPVIDQTTTVIDGGHITTGTIDAGVVNVTNLNASEITSGTLSADFIRLYGYMDVFQSSSGSQVGGNFGYMSGSHAFPDGSSETTAGIAMVNERSTDTHYLIVTDSGVRLQEHLNNGATSSSVYLADGRFVIDCESGLIVPRGKLLSNINYGGVPMSRVASIWENPGPTASFSAQTITDNRFLYYDILIFEIAWSTSYPGVVNSAVVFNGSNTTSQGSIIAQPSVTWYNGNYVSAAFRQFTINGSSIVVGSGCHATGTSVSTSADSYAIPIRIMGIMI